MQNFPREGRFASGEEFPFSAQRLSCSLLRPIFLLHNTKRLHEKGRPYGAP